MVLKSFHTSKADSVVNSGAAPDGLSSTVNQVSISVGGADAEVYFAGLAP
jgi:hypothetical protein